MNIPENLITETALWQSGMRHICGVDEAGRGPLAGPVVAAAVIFEPQFWIEGVTDSKKLTETKRELFFQKILDGSLAYGVGIVSAAEIDRINIRQATLKAMQTAVAALNIAPEYVLIDGNDAPELAFPHETLVKGDSRSFTIAAASIIAKVTRDRMLLALDRDFPAYGFAQHKGYGTAKHIAAIRQVGPCPEHRRSFLGKILSR